MLLQIDRVTTRRKFLQLAVLGSGLAGTSLLISACGDDDDEDEVAPEAEPSPTEVLPDTSDTEEEEPGDEVPDDEEPPTGSGGSLVHIRASDAESLDPQFTNSQPSVFVFMNIFDTLIAKNMDLEFEPLVAESWEISDDGLEYRFMIREGLRFHDGGELTAESVKYTFDRAGGVDSPSQSPVMAFISSYERSELESDSTVKLILSEPSASFLSNIAVGYFGIISEEAVERLGDQFGRNPVGSGPWMFSDWIEGERITLVPYPEYQNFRSYVRNQGPPLADELVFWTVPEEQTRMVAFETGEANHIIPSKEAVSNLQDSNYQVFFSEGGTTIYFLEFVTEPLESETGEPVWKPPFDDIRLRQAVGHAVNPDEMVDTIMGGMVDRNYSPMPTGLFAYDPAIEEYGFHYDPDRAREILEEAGWSNPNGNGVRTKDGEDLDLLLWTFTLSSSDRVVQVIQNQLSQVGINVRLEVIETGTFVSRLPEGIHDMAFLGVGWPEADLLYVVSQYNWGLGNYRPQEYMDLITEAREIADLDERRVRYFEAAKIMLGDAAMIPFWTELGVAATRNEVNDFKLGPDGMQVWVDAWVES